MRDMIFDDGEPGRTPEKAAQEAMRPVLPKRFYKTVSIDRKDDDWQILLDGRSVKTPAKSILAFPTKAAAELAASEWDDQEEQINPAEMPVTRLANTAIDGIANDPQAVLEEITRFAASDLVCYRASHPEQLVEAQIKHWDNVLDQVMDLTGAHFETGEGIAHITQDKDAIAAFSARLRTHDAPLAIACLHTMTSLTGSAMIALLVGEGKLSLDDAWLAANVDEDHNISLWGEDYEASKRRKVRFAEMQAAHDLFMALQ